MRLTALLLQLRLQTQRRVHAARSKQGCSCMADGSRYNKKKYEVFAKSIKNCR